MQCIIDHTSLKINLNDRNPENILDKRWNVGTELTTLSIVDSMKENYGVVFVREIKMWTGQYNFLLDVARM